MSAQTEALQQIRQTLQARRSELLRRQRRIDVDLRHGNEPLVSDADDQAIQVQNDDPLQAIGAAAMEEVRAIDAALERMNLGLHGVCSQCGEHISPARLHAVAYAITCAKCANS